ncbi:hypothetical protein AB0J86_00415 [Micromonospora sp. NPDC049559]|uniref:hypothetical protein n=1 Tax=Micromonospora sp. NPDC049559 TaxID=3155923 RepID=UPI00344776D7
MSEPPRSANPPAPAAPAAPARSGLARFGARLGVGALFVAALAAGGALTALRPNSDVRERPFVTAGGLGERVSTRTFDVTVLDVRGAAQVARFRQAHDTGGVWIVVRLRLTARNDPTTVGYAALRDERGRLYQQSERFTQPLTNSWVLQPGIPVEGEVAFEVPRAAASRLWLRLAENLAEQGMDSMAEVALLPVDPSTVDGWTRSTAPVPLQTPGAVGT